MTKIKLMKITRPHTTTGIRRLLNRTQPVNNEDESLMPDDALTGETDEHRMTVLAPFELQGDPVEELDYAIGLARHYDADLWLLPICAGPGVAVDARGLSSYLKNSWSRSAQVQLWDWVLRARELHYRTFPVFGCGDNHAEQILRLARKLKADFIVVHTAGPGRAFAGLPQGEADEVLRRATTPVFVAFPRQPSGQGRLTGQ